MLLAQTHCKSILALSPVLQTTDKKVNEVTPALFKLAPDAHAMADMEVLTPGRCFGFHSASITIVITSQNPLCFHGADSSRSIAACAAAVIHLLTLQCAF